MSIILVGGALVVLLIFYLFQTIGPDENSSYVSEAVVVGFNFPPTPPLEGEPAINTAIIEIEDFVGKEYEGEFCIAQSPTNPYQLEERLMVAYEIGSEGEVYIVGVERQES